MHFHIVIVIVMNMHKLGYKNYCCYKLYNNWDNSIRLLAIENAYMEIQFSKCSDYHRRNYPN